MNLRILTFAWLTLAASAQMFTFGVKGGVPTQTPLGETGKMPFVLGPSINIHLVSGLSFESGLLYHRIGRASNYYAFAYPENTVTLVNQTWRGSALEIPFLPKYRFLDERRTWRPFLAAGPTLRRTSIRSVATGSILSGNILSPIENPGFITAKDTQWHLDPSLSAGVDIRAGRFHIEPEVRYSYWTAGKTAPLRKNQVDLLVGFRF